MSYSTRESLEPKITGTLDDLVPRTVPVAYFCKLTFNQPAWEQPAGPGSWDAMQQEPVRYFLDDFPMDTGQELIFMVNGQTFSWPKQDIHTMLLVPMNGKPLAPEKEAS